MKEFNYLFDIAEAKRKLFDKKTQPLSWGFQEGKFDTLKEIKEWLPKYETEIRKPLEYEIAKLKTRLNILIESISKYTEPLPNGVIFDIGSDELRYEIVDELINKIDWYRNQIKQERQKVIAELEEWSHFAGLNFNKRNNRVYIYKDELKQKLNEMKGGSDE